MGKAKINDKDFASRMQELLNLQFDSNNSKFAQAVGVAVTSLNRWLTGEADPSRTNLIKIAQASGVSLEWLALGIGEPTAQDTKNPTLTSNVTYKYDINFNNKDEYELIDDYSEVQVSAGVGNINDEYQAVNTAKVEKAWFIARRINPDDCILLSVDGDSMHPTLQDGEKVIVDRSKQLLREGKIFVINHQGTMWVKKVRLKFDGIELLSDNPVYDPIKLTPQEADELIIIGQVVRSYKDF